MTEKTADTDMCNTCSCALSVVLKCIELHSFELQPCYYCTVSYFYITTVTVVKLKLVLNLLKKGIQYYIRLVCSSP